MLVHYVAIRKDLPKVQIFSTIEISYLWGKASNSFPNSLPFLMTAPCWKTQKYPFMKVSNQKCVVAIVITFTFFLFLSGNTPLFLLPLLSLVFLFFFWTSFPKFLPISFCKSLCLFAFLCHTKFIYSCHHPSPSSTNCIYYIYISLTGCATFSAFPNSFPTNLKIITQQDSPC